MIGGFVGIVYDKEFAKFAETFAVNLSQLSATGEIYTLIQYIHLYWSTFDSLKRVICTHS